MKSDVFFKYCIMQSQIHFKTLKIRLSFITNCARNLCYCRLLMEGLSNVFSSSFHNNLRMAAVSLIF